MINTNNQIRQTMTTSTEVIMEEDNEPPPVEPSLSNNWLWRMVAIIASYFSVRQRRNENVMHSCLFGKHCGFVRAFPIYQVK